MEEGGTLYSYQFFNVLTVLQCVNTKINCGITGLDRNGSAPRWDVSALVKAFNNQYPPTL